MLVPPENFGIVEAGIYRSTKLESENFPFLQTLDLKSIIILDTEKPPRALSNFLENNPNLQFFNLGGLKISNHQHTGITSKVDQEDIERDVELRINNFAFNTPKTFANTLSLARKDQWMLIEKNIVMKTFEIMFNKKNYPMLVIDSSATLIGILRKIQKWNFNSILNEYRIYSGMSTKNNYYAETFLELIQVELIPYEHQSRSRRNSRGNSNMYLRTNSIDTETGDMSEASDANTLDEDYEAVDDDDEDDYYDDLDDDILSASPQIPANLLKMVEQGSTSSREQRKRLNSLDGKRSPYQRNNSFHNSPSMSGGGEHFLSMRINNSNHNRRRSSTQDNSYNMYKNMKFRNNTKSPSVGSSGGPETPGTSPILRRKMSLSRSNSHIEFNSLVDFKYYHNLQKYPKTFQNVNVLKIKLPPEYKLPDWFIAGRNIWEREYQRLNSDQ
ncbi:Protein OCA4 [Candida viswanathii]|uniref:Protein OCA4 n=1 Tax=Candida viswanathii TaxID=5486 RepID=A0A367YGC3_9ASCO|nr:Protein OCA4 [Candida viswanathii]